MTQSERPGRGRRCGRAWPRVAAAALVGLAVACAPAVRVALPDPGQAVVDPAAHAVIARLASACTAIRTVTTNIGVSGRVGRQRVRGTLQVGIARPGQLRIDAVAPFGAPVFTLAADGRSTTLVMPREHAFITGVSVEQLLDALVQLPLSADDLAALTLACPSGALDDAQSRRHGDGTVSAADATGIVAFARTSPRERVTGLLFPPNTARQRQVAAVYQEPAGSARRVIEVAVGPSSAPLAQLRLTLSDLDTGGTLAAAAFEVAIPAGARALTLDDLRRMSPFAAAPVSTH